MKLPLFAAAAAVCAFLPNPTGTRPTELVNLAVVSTGPNTMTCTGRLVDIGGAGVAGVPVKVFQVGQSYFSQIGTAWTAGNGTFTYAGPKNAVGTKVQIDADAAGAWSRPFPTYSRP